ncbi:MAG: hypothetical protein WDW38_010388 [Sanguina aurantia]
MNTDMMLEVQRLQCADMCATASRMVDIIAAMAASSLPDADSLRAHLPPMRALRSRWLETATSMPLFPPEVYAASLPEQALLVTAFTSLLTALVPQLGRLGRRLSSPPPSSSSIGTPEEEVFWELWGFLVAACSAYGTAVDHTPTLLPEETPPTAVDHTPTLLPEGPSPTAVGHPPTLLPEETPPTAVDHTPISLPEGSPPPPLHSPLHDALTAMLAWLLPFSRSPAWRAMRQEHGLQRRNVELLIVLAQPVKCLYNLGLLEGTLLADHMGLLPPGLLLLVCCILSEQFGTAPPVVEQPQPAWARSQQATNYTQSRHTADYRHPVTLHLLLDSLSKAVANLAAAHARAGGSKGTLCSLMTSPAVLQLLKDILILPPEDPITRPALVGKTLRSLLFWLDMSTRQLDEDCHTAVTPLPTVPTGPSLQHGATSAAVVATCPRPTPMVPCPPSSHRAAGEALLIIHSPMGDASAPQVVDLHLQTRDVHAADTDRMGALPVHSNPILSGAVLATDVRLLRALGAHMREKKEVEKRKTKTIERRSGGACVSVADVCELQALVLKGWLWYGRHHNDAGACIPPAVVSTMLDSVAGVVKRCTGHGLQLMLHAQGKRIELADAQSRASEKKQARRPRGVLQHRHARIAGRDASRLACMGLPELGVRELRVVRNLLHTTWDFHVQLQHNGVRPTSGKCAVSASFV